MKLNFIAFRSLKREKEEEGEKEKGRERESEREEESERNEKSDPPFVLGRRRTICFERRNRRYYLARLETFDRTISRKQ